jgi:hypothetical protein
MVRSHFAIFATGGADRLRAYSLWLRREAAWGATEREWPPSHSLTRLGAGRRCVRSTVGPCDARTSCGRLARSLTDCWMTRGLLAEQIRGQAPPPPRSRTPRPPPPPPLIQLCQPVGFIVRGTGCYISAVLPLQKFIASAGFRFLKISQAI